RKLFLILQHGRRMVRRWMIRKLRNVGKS
ncbi:hypothetical protein A5834_001871, partial [Enterococcus faecium]